MSPEVLCEDRNEQTQEETCRTQWDTARDAISKGGILVLAHSERLQSMGNPQQSERGIKKQGSMEEVSKKQEGAERNRYSLLTAHSLTQGIRKA